MVNDEEHFVLWREDTDTFRDVHALCEKFTPTVGVLCSDGTGVVNCDGHLFKNSSNFLLCMEHAGESTVDLTAGVLCSLTYDPFNGER